MSGYWTAEEDAAFRAAADGVGAAIPAEDGTIRVHHYRQRPRCWLPTGHRPRTGSARSVSSLLRA
jgi:hypothetical protein